ncbi:MAG: ABC transporter substrate-binding protein [Rhodospirillaceae bacterium]|nr:ABC transporter substrate-binding protein [Rhodospirillaceae bacterium]
MKLARRAVMAAALVLMAAPVSAEGPKLADAAGRPIEKGDTRRVVAIGGALTEIVYLLGAEANLVAVDTTSQYPPEALQRLPNVGYMRTLSAEGILALRPTLVIADAEAGPPAALAQIKTAGTAVVILHRDTSVGGIVYKIRAVAKLLGRESEGVELAAAFEADMAALAAAIAKTKEKPRVLFVLNVARGAPMVSGTDTAADSMIALAGGVNAIRGYKGYKPLSPEAAVAGRPDVVLTTDHGLLAVGGADRLLSRPDLGQTPAGRNKRLVTMDSLLLLGLGPRTPLAVHKLAAALHPGLALPALKMRSKAQ